MFPPESPHPSRYRHLSSRHASDKNENRSVWFIRLMQILFILLGTAAIVAMIFFGPQNKHLVCDPNLHAHNTLLGFGSCKSQ